FDFREFGIDGHSVLVLNLNLYPNLNPRLAPSRVCHTQARTRLRLGLRLRVTIGFTAVRELKLSHTSPSPRVSESGRASRSSLAVCRCQSAFRSCAAIARTSSRLASNRSRPRDDAS